MGFFDKLKAGLQKTKAAVFGQLNQVMKNFRKVFTALLPISMMKMMWQKR